ncbi:Stage IV sporulation protein yqfD [Bacillus subtilis subsp. subtilis]|nr:Stage IV sporulation protein yqfD [Bacillus subtilis subsp. subtilis]
MKNKWLSFFSGKVQLELTGRGIERLLNECTRQGIPVFHVKKRKKPYRYIYSFRMYMPFGG